MNARFLLPSVLIVAGVVVTAARLVLAFGAEAAPVSGPVSTYVGPVIFFLGAVALGRAWRRADASERGRR